jgi:hypothetical protein
MMTIACFSLLNSCIVGKFESNLFLGTQQQKMMDALLLAASPTNDTINDSNVNKPRAGGRRGPKYHSAEDLLICQSFVETYEHPMFLGSNPRGELFVQKMFDLYQTKINHSTLPLTNGITLLARGRPARALYSRFKVVSYWVGTFIDLQKNTPIKSDHEEIGHFFACCELFMIKYKKNFNEFVGSYNYLKTKSKWKEYFDKLANCRKKQMQQLTGKRAASTQHPIDSTSKKTIKVNEIVASGNDDLVSVYTSDSSSPSSSSDGSFLSAKVELLVTNMMEKFNEQKQEKDDEYRTKKLLLIEKQILEQKKRTELEFVNMLNEPARSITLAMWYDKYKDISNN